MASGTSRNGGCQSLGANMSSNDAHEHVIDINLQEEPIKQQETQKLNAISVITSCIFSIALKLISLFRASGSSAAVTCAVEMNRISLPPLPLLNNQNPPISSFQDLQEPLLITDEQKLPDSVGSFFTASNQLQDVVGGLEESVKAVLEGWTSTSCSREKLAASTAALEEVVNKVKGVHQHQSKIQTKQQSDGESLDAELCGIKRWKNIYYIIFTVLAGFFGGAGISFAFKIHPVAVTLAVFAAAAGASVVSIAVGKWFDSHQDELKIRVEKCKDITAAISGACILALEDLHYIEVLASTLKSKTESILKMVDSGAESNVVVVTGTEALKQGLQQLETKLDRCSKNADSSRQAVVNSTIKNLDLD